ncbi:hypothetical protein [Amycolatopsis anabasis]|uniref:hypothetical protein n=1 Tax=Amycolatopsis anabasis TaxID=1840409 RepID=UPI00131DC374|nr:hypothetical protein [Amycolatopsis anabasis]
MLCDDETRVAVDGTGARSAVQCADVVLGEVRTRAEGGRWLDAVFTRYPGCLVAAARHRRGRWCLLAVRDGAPVLVTPGARGRLFRHTVAALARGVHDGLVTR